MSRCFPITICCLPDIKLFHSFRQVHSCQHLVLLLAVTVGFGLTLYDVTLAVGENCVVSFNGYPTICYNFWIDLLFLLPCTLYLYTILANYDDERRLRLKEVLRQKSATQRAFNETIRDMVVLWQQSADSNLVLTTRNFEEKLADFMKFLVKIQSKLFNRSRDLDFVLDEQAIFAEMRQLIRVWFLVYGETSIDPQDRPIVLEAQGELDNCSTVRQLLETGVRLLNGCRTVANIERYMSFLSQDPQAACNAALTNGGAQLRRSLTDLETSHSVEQKRPQLCSWLGCWRSPQSPQTQCCRCGGVDDDYLVYASCCCGACCWVRIIDWPHFRVVLAFIAGILVIGIKVALPIMDPEFNWKYDTLWSLADVSPIFVYVICLVVLLTKVEYINMVAATKVELERAADLNKKVSDLRIEIQNFTAQSQDLTELWLHCTIPRLDLMKEIHSHLARAPLADLLAQLKLANARLAELEMWCGEAKTSTPNGDNDYARRRLSSRIDGILRETSGEFDLDESTGGLEKLLHNFDQQFAEELGKDVDKSEGSFPMPGMFRSPMLDNFVAAVGRTGPLGSLTSFLAGSRDASPPRSRSVSSLSIEGRPHLRSIDSFIDDFELEEQRQRQHGVPRQQLMNASQSPLVRY